MNLFCFTLIRRMNNLAGFTVVELLTSLVIVSILAAISIPFSISKIKEAKSVEAINTLNAFTKLQTSYYLENSRFSSSFYDLALPSETANYSYQIDVISPSESADSGETVACAFAGPKFPGLELLSICVAN